MGAVMRNIPWLTLGAVGALWTIIMGAGVAGWMIGKSEAAQEYADLQRRINAGAPASGACGIDVELLDLRGSGSPALRAPGEAATQIVARPGYLHLREMLTVR